VFVRDFGQTPGEFRAQQRMRDGNHNGVR
jgi:hypothetical protein